MTTKPLTIAELRNRINAGEGKDPLVFLEAVMNGQDPRSISEVFKLAQLIQEFSEGEPTPADWAEIYQLICETAKFGVSSIGESITGAKSLAEYLHPKRKQIDVNGIGGQGTAEVTELTEEEIELFKEKFNDEF